MKINIVIPALGNSGGIEVVYRYAQLLLAMNHDVILYKEVKARNRFRYNSRMKNFIHLLYCTLKAIVKIKKKSSIDLYVWKLTDKSVRDADCIIATSWPTAYAINDLNEDKGKKYYFIQGFEVWDNYERGLNSYMLPLHKIVVSEWINNQLKKSLNIGPFPKVLNAVDHFLFYDSNSRNKHGKKFLMLNHTLEIKGVKNGIAAFEKIKTEYPDATLTMFGTCDGFGLPYYVEYYRSPSKEILHKLYCDANFFLFPSLEEGWGMTPVEAMACGCVVIGTNTGFAQDLGIDRINMYISLPGDVEAMVDNIRHALNNKDIDSISQNAKNTISSLSWNNSCKKLEQLLSSNSL